MFIGAVLLVLIFMTLMPGPRHAVLASLAWGANWFVAWAPFSFIIVILIFMAAPVTSYLIMKSWPKVEEPENPMAKYRKAEDVIVED